MHPKIILSINIKADIENAKWFVKNGEFVDMFLPQNFRYIQSKKFSLTERNKIITEYTKHIHKLNEKEIQKGVENIRKEWSKIEENFFKITEKIFNGHSFPKGKYTGYASIYGMYPRNIKDKTFFFPYTNEKWNPLKTIAHESMHFIFFDYIKKNFGINEDDKIKGKNKKFVWQISETFNNVIENWKPYNDIFNTNEKSKPYFGCEKMFSTMTKQWKENQDIKRLLNKWF